MKTQFFIPYKVLVSISAISVGIAGFEIGYRIILATYGLTHSQPLIFLGLGMGIFLMILLNKWRIYYDNFINGQFSLWLKVMIWCLAEGFALSFVVMPFGAILAFFAKIVGG